MWSRSALTRWRFPNKKADNEQRVMGALENRRAKGPGVPAFYLLTAMLCTSV